LVLWHRNSAAPWPTNPEESLKFYEKTWAAIDELIAKDEIIEMGSFLNGTSGYTIGKGDSSTLLKNLSMFTPFWEFTVHEIIPYPKSREIFTSLMKQPR